MSSPGFGINPLAIYDPETYQKELAIQRRQALAQSLLGSIQQNSGSAPYGGLANAGKSILGAFLAKRADQQLGQLYNPMQTPTNTGQVSNVPNAGMSQGQALGAALQGQQSPQPPQQTAGSGNTYLPPAAQRIYDQIPHIAGMPPQQALNYFLSNPTGYQAEWAKQFEATDMQKNTNAAFGADTPEAKNMMQGTLAKGAAINLRPGGGALNYGTGQIITMPNQQGMQTTFPQGMNGSAQVSMAPGAAQALTQATAAQGLGKAQTTPAIGYGADNMPIAVPQSALLGGGSGMQRVAPAPMPGGGQPGIPQPASQPLRPELPAGQGTYMQTQAKDAGDRHDATVAAAAESPMRINVLDNIVNLSKQGVATGPGQDWQNTVLGYIANAPGLSKIMAGAKDNVAKFQELQKFTYQNAIRSWQAAGGTGTDAQMESMAHANPNDHLFPQALQGIAQWGKAAELAVQGKANAQDAFLGQNGQTPQNQIKFENTWRNAFEPRVFQYAIMSPQEKQIFAAHELKTPAAAKAFLARQQQLKALGAIQ